MWRADVAHCRVLRDNVLVANLAKDGSTSCVTLVNHALDHHVQIDDGRSLREMRAAIPKDDEGRDEARDKARERLLQFVRSLCARHEVRCAIARAPKNTHGA